MPYDETPVHHTGPADSQTARRPVTRSPRRVSRFLAIAALVFLAGACAERTPEADGPGVAAAADHEALLPVEVDGRWGYINAEGEEIIAPRFERAWRFSDGLALVRSDGRFGYIDRSGQFAVPPRFTDGWHFSDGMAPVELDSTWAYVDRDGEVVADTQLNMDAEDFVELRYYEPELHLFRSNGVYGYADDAGDPVIDARFENAWRFSDGRARVRSNGKWGYIDREGTFVVEPRFDLAWDFADGVAMVQTDGETAYIDPDGNFVWPPTR